MAENRTESFLEEVTEQISYRPLRPAISRELREHIEDRREEYEREGMRTEEAEKRAVEAMGDAVSIGTDLNAIHRVQHAPALTALTFVLLMAGFALAAYMQWTPEQEVGGYLYYLIAPLLLLVVTWKGYPFLVRCWRPVMVAVILIYLVQAGLFGVTGFGWSMPGKAGVVYFSILMLAPVLTMIIYRFRKSQKKLVVLFAAVTTLWIGLVTFKIPYRNMTAMDLFLFSICGTICFLFYRKILLWNMRTLMAVSLGCAALTGAVFVTSSGQRTLLQIFLHPEEAVYSTWDDAYNSVLIRNLLSRTPLTCGLELSPEEQMNYGTGAWYFADKDERQIGLDATNLDTEEKLREFRQKSDALWEEGVLPRYIDYQESNVTLWDMLPQHYHNNYVIATGIFLFGWIPGMVLVAVLLLFYVLLFSCILKIRGILASSLAFCCGQCLLWQGVFYLLGNFGYQYGTFPNLPMVSEGRISILFNMLLLGMIFSAYRYDRVMGVMMEGDNAGVFYAG